MKKLIPILTIASVSLLLGGCANNITKVENKKLNYELNTISNAVNSISKANKQNKTLLNKYNLTILPNDDMNIETINNANNLNLNTTEVTEENNVSPEINNSNNELIDNDTTIDEQENINTTEETKEHTPKNTELSTLYSLSEDIEAQCDEFCELKNAVTNAIVETENLINKIKNKEVSLTREERINLSEQAMQLKSLSKQLSNITTELAFNLSDLQQIMLANNNDINNLSLKYLIVLDNLINGNEMLQSGLTSLNMINNMMNKDSKITYRYQTNNEPEVIKEYQLNENGEINEISNKNTQENATNIDSMANNTMSNIDTYKSDIPSNIDTFFNTALLDNEFMYGKNGYGYGMNPYMYQYNQYEQNNKNITNSGNNLNNTQHDVQSAPEKVEKEKRKRFNIKKNIDTYRNEKTPDIKTKINNFKESISGWFKN